MNSSSIFQSGLTPVIGLMAGTSVDGIDAALVATDGKTLIRTDNALTSPYRQETKELIFEALDTPCNHTYLGRLIAEDHAAAVANLCKQTPDLKPQLIGFHGQTLLHQPEQGRTLQCGDAQLLADLCQTPVIHQFRSNDVKAGGEGAPLAPIYHRLLIDDINLPLPAAIANIGGITNITRWDGTRLIGFDTGPGNALMDALARDVLGTQCDIDGKLAATGTPDEARVNAILRQPFFMRTPPKSLDRSDVLTLAEAFDGLQAQDKMASLCALSAAALVMALPDVKHLVLSGGGARNPVLVKMIKERSHGEVTTMDEHGINADFIEAELMAYLAARSHARLPITFPETTGVSKPMLGGTMVQPAS